MRSPLDLVLAAAGALVYLPFWAVVSVLIVLEDRRSFLFLQGRIGARRVPFSIVKLRTMRDGRVTRVGRWLRRTGLDETTQFVNVLRGDMRMVGPRPLTADDVARLGWDSAAYDDRFSVPPGITGLAQLLGGVGARHSLRLDRLYLRRRSAWLDLWLVVLSFAANVIGKQRARDLWKRLRRRRRSRPALGPSRRTAAGARAARETRGDGVA